MRQLRIEQHGDSSSVLIDTTMKDINSAASGTIASIKQWANRKSQTSDRAIPSTRSYEYDERQCVHRGLLTSIIQAANECATPQGCGSPRGGGGCDKIR
jgi:hypothetical protein